MCCLNDVCTLVIAGIFWQVFLCGKDIPSAMVGGLTYQVVSYGVLWYVVLVIRFTVVVTYTSSPNIHKNNRGAVYNAYNNNNNNNNTLIFLKVA